MSVAPRTKRLSERRRPAREGFARLGVAWFEEPVSSDDLAGLRLLRDRAPGSMQIAAGEYGYTPYYFRAMLEAGAVDVLQADATRCGGITGFLRAAALCDAFQIPLSSEAVRKSDVQEPICGGGSEARLGLLAV
jgi:L-alanine-DL-glutamate epimerase-like enolase superfamily enzyme